MKQISKTLGCITLLVVVPIACMVCVTVVMVDQMRQMFANDPILGPLSSAIGDWMNRPYTGEIQDWYIGESADTAEGKVFIGGQVTPTGYAGPESFYCIAPTEKFCFVECGEYGCVRSSIYTHDGIDYTWPCGQEVRAVMGGKVIYAAVHPAGYGLLVVIENNGYYTYYGHLREARVVPDQIVEAGDVIGISGGYCKTDPLTCGNSSGCHVHFAIRYYDPEKKLLIPVNPKTATLPGQTELCDWYFGNPRCDGKYAVNPAGFSLANSSLAFQIPDFSWVPVFGNRNSPSQDANESPCR